MRDLNWKLNEFFPLSDLLKIITIGTCYKDGTTGFGPLIAINLGAGSVQVADCLTCKREDNPLKEAILILKLHDYSFHIALDDRGALIIRGPEGGSYVIRKKPASDLKIARMEIGGDDEGGDEDSQPPQPSRFDAN